MSTTTTRNDPTLRRAYGAVAGAGLVVAVSCATFLSPAWGASALAGAAIALGNLWVLSRAVRNLFAAEGSAAVPWSLVAVLKFFALLGVTYLLVKSRHVEPLGLALGFGALPLGIVLGSLLQAPGSAGRPLNGETDHA